MTDPRQKELERLCRSIATGLKGFLEDHGHANVGFALHLMDVNSEDGFMAYISSVNADDYIEVLRAQLERLEAGITKRSEGQA